MKQGFEDIPTKLAGSNIRPSIQRIKVLEYLIKHQCHPTVEQIYQDLLIEIPTLSKSTVYNTLKLLHDSGLIRILSMEGNESRYDSVTKNHGHFICDECGAIYNFNIDIDSLETEELTGFIVNDKSVCLKGVCPKCLLNINLNYRKEQNQ